MKKCLKDSRLRVLIVDLEYSRDEINEPINVDTIIDSFDEYVMESISLDIKYRSMGDFSSFNSDNYDVVLISTKVSSGDTLKKILNEVNGKTVIVGGMIATYAHEAILKDFREVIVSLGECECNLNQILHLCIENNDLAYVKNKLIENKVSGIAFVDHVGEIYYSPIVAFDLSTVKTPLKHRALSETLKKGGLVRVETSRGCPWNKCSFCCVSRRYAGSAWRAFPIQRTIDEIIFLSDAGVKCIYFTDEDFVGNFEHFSSLFRKIKELKNQGIISKDIKFWGSTSVYTLKQFGDDRFNEFLSLSVQCGIDVFFLGIESGCDSQLKRFSKGVNKADNLNILNNLHKAGIYFDVGFIMFDAKTTLQEIYENLCFCIESGLNKTVSRLAKPLRVIPHTTLCAEYEREGILSGPLDVSELVYPYSFLDKKVQYLFDSLCFIDSLILDEANKLQADIRTDGKYDDTARVEQLSHYRNLEFDFIQRFIEVFGDTDIDEASLDLMIKNFLSSL